MGMAAPTDALSELVAEEMRLRTELSKARQELLNKQHTLEILHKEKDVLEAQRPQALAVQVAEADKELAELRRQMGEAAGPVFGAHATNASPAGSSTSAASGWGALIHVAKARTLAQPSPVGRCARARFVRSLLRFRRRYPCAAARL